MSARELARTVAEAGILAEAQALRQSELVMRAECCGWDRRLVTSLDVAIDGVPLFLKGSCSQFVEYIYTSVGLDIVDEAVTRDPDDPDRIPPATQIAAFNIELYPLRRMWSSALSKFPDCLAVT